MKSSWKSHSSLNLLTKLKIQSVKVENHKKANQKTSAKLKSKAFFQFSNKFSWYFSCYLKISSTFFPQISTVFNVFFAASKHIFPCISNFLICSIKSANKFRKKMVFCARQASASGSDEFGSQLLNLITRSWYRNAHLSLQLSSKSWKKGRRHKQRSANGSWVTKINWEISSRSRIWKWTLRRKEIREAIKVEVKWGV